MQAHGLTPLFSGDQKVKKRAVKTLMEPGIEQRAVAVAQDDLALPIGGQIRKLACGGLFEKRRVRAHARFYA
jgi:hypothetical protein